MTSVSNAGARFGIRCGYDDEIPAPANRATVSEINKPVLCLPDGRALVRQIGFGPMAQTSGALPQVSGNTSYGGKKKSSKKKRGC